MKYFLPILTVTACLFLFAGVLQAQRLIPEPIRESVREHVESGYAPGIVVAVYDLGKKEYYAYGHTDVGQKLKVDKNTLFEIGSISKTMTAYLAAREFPELTQKELPLGQLLPGGQVWPQVGERPIDLVDLLNHTSGFPRMPANFAPADPQNPYADYGRAQLLESLKSLQLKSAPGATNEYSNYAFGVLTLILESHSGKSYAELLSEYLTTPLEMNRTVIDEDEIEGFNKSFGHIADERVFNWDFDVMVGAGGVRSTATDMLTYMIAMMQDRDDPMHNAMQLCLRETFSVGDGAGVALGWHTRRIGDSSDTRTAYWHNGQTGGFHSVAAFSPTDHKAVVILCNSVANIDALAFRMFDEGVELPRLRRSINMSGEELQKYTGSYPLHPNFILRIFLEGGKLMAEATGQPPFQLYPESPTRFFYKVVDADVVFKVEADGSVSGLTLFQEGMEIPAAKRQE